MTERCTKSVTPRRLKPARSGWSRGYDVREPGNRAPLAIEMSNRGMSIKTGVPPILKLRAPRLRHGGHRGLYHGARLDWEGKAPAGPMLCFQIAQTAHQEVRPPKDVFRNPDNDG